jgi:hypothetical protein
MSQVRKSTRFCSNYKVVVSNKSVDILERWWRQPLQQVHLRIMSFLLRIAYCHTDNNLKYTYYFCNATKVTQLIVVFSTHNTQVTHTHTHSQSSVVFHRHLSTFYQLQQSYSGILPSNPLQRRNQPLQSFCRVDHFPPQQDHHCRHCHRHRHRVWNG